jgi:urease accessory protein
MVRGSVRVGDGASAEWLPQETILFDGSALDRALDIELAPDARLLGIETLVFGRDAMGERVHQARLRDRIRIRRGGRWLLHDAVRMDGTVSAMLARPAIGNGARVVATLFHVAPDAEAHLDAARAALDAHDVEAGASAWDGMLLVRMVGAGSAAVRAAAVSVLDLLRGGRPLPRVWLC